MLVVLLFVSLVGDHIEDGTCLAFTPPLEINPDVGSSIFPEAWGIVITA